MAKGGTPLGHTRGYQYELKVNNQERSRLRQCAGLRRFAWNWCLAERQRLFREKKGKTRYYGNLDVISADIMLLLKSRQHKGQIS